MLLKFKIWWLTRKARRQYNAYFIIFDQMSCGHHLAQHMSHRLRMHALEFDAALDELKALGDIVPVGRLTNKE